MYRSMLMGRNIAAARTGCNAAISRSFLVVAHHTKQAHVKPF
jgi:hypothetical protein